MSQTNEHAFESNVTAMLANAGWRSGHVTDWDKGLALFPSHVVGFIRATQPKLWANMLDLHGQNLPAMLVAALVKELDGKGSLHVLRHGFKFFGKTFRLAYFKPAHGLSPDVQALYERNDLTVTRQVPCHPDKADTADMVFAVNGLPVATCELKNPSTGQTWRNAVTQYREDRDPRTPLFGFKSRALVHFAADPDEVHMCTRLAGEESVFLPFNRGSHPGQAKCGKGNPAHPSGYRTGYLWSEVLEWDCFLDILGHYMESTARAEGGRTPWGLVLPPESAAPGEPETAGRDPRGGVQGGVTPGVWGSTGLALERSLLAERRNVMARLRTHMARARTGLSFIRTGMNFTAVGLGLLVSFGFSSLGWTALETAVLGLGVLLVADGLYWHLPADKVRRALPYCYHGLEIALPDYARPVGEWPKTEFDNACK